LNGTYIKNPLGVVSVNRIKRLSTEILNEYQDKFGTDFSNNKKLLNEITIIRSKGLKNEIAGYITKILQRKQKFEDRKQQMIENEKSIKTESAPEPESAPELETVEKTVGEEILNENESKETS